MTKSTEIETEEERKKRKYEEYRRCPICKGKGVLYIWQVNQKWAIKCKTCNGWGSC